MENEDQPLKKDKKPSSKTKVAPKQLSNKDKLVQFLNNNFVMVLSSMVAIFGIFLFFILFHKKSGLEPSETLNNITQSQAYQNGEGIAKSNEVIKGIQEKARLKGIESQNKIKDLIAQANRNNGAQPINPEPFAIDFKTTSSVSLGYTYYGSDKIQYGHFNINPLTSISMNAANIRTDKPIYQYNILNSKAPNNAYLDLNDDRQGSNNNVDSNFYTVKKLTPNFLKLMSTFAGTCQAVPAPQELQALSQVKTEEEFSKAFSNYHNASTLVSYKIVFNQNDTNVTLIVNRKTDGTMSGQVIKNGTFNYANCDFDKITDQIDSGLFSFVYQ